MRYPDGTKVVLQNIFKNTMKIENGEIGIINGWDYPQKRYIVDIEGRGNWTFDANQLRRAK